MRSSGKYYWSSGLNAFSGIIKTIYSPAKSFAAAKIAAFGLFTWLCFSANLHVTRNGYTNDIVISMDTNNSNLQIIVSVLVVLCILAANTLVYFGATRSAELKLKEFSDIIKSGSRSLEELKVIAKYYK